ncbi:MAG: peptidoglycan DD-metalloendopeptidase family protein [Candidatus Peregrinibacteria bacterium]|nr:peptidoglycan DD-metalloendopeptidase family protein [Candidatus Peregrinibacteria bacterium]MCB9807802.1 peptidoglycan DD-metalloendopeptidase family protein [Candidatus Peribacteria bacterium]
MPLNIEVSRPFSFLFVMGITIWGLSFAMVTQPQEAKLTGQGGEVETLAIHTAEDEVRRARLESELAAKHIEVLTYQLRRLESEREMMQDDLTEELNEEYRKGLRLLLDLIEGKRRADDKMVESFRQMWDANRASMAAAALSDENPSISISWPVEPVYGISAIFNDPDYKEFFGLEHKAVDIPVLQSTPVKAADSGTVEEVSDNGMGYNFITVRHNGYVTLYGHVSAFMVKKGDHVSKGDVIALSGGMPGTPGAGHLTTGPHLHFELITGKGNINPLSYLPASGVNLRR